jgi:formylglycine-generating enzyme required for sulfatase activity
VTGGGCRSNPNPRDAGWGRGNRPVIYVSWNDAQEYVQWLSGATGKPYRLLTESEWEYAAGSFPNAANVRDPSGDFAWTASNSANMTHPVGRKSPNEYGLYDMWGNVWEWVADCWTPRCSQRVMRGGSYNYTSRQLRINSRNANGPRGELMVVGFRVATTP